MARRAAGSGLPRTIRSTAVPSAAKARFDIAHGDGRIQAGAEAAAGDLADDAAGLVGDLGAFARRRAAIGQDADALLGGAAVP